MAVTYDPRAYETENTSDIAAHYATYRSFVKYTTIFVAHVAVILALMAYFLV
jgi:hypothetical protein